MAATEAGTPKVEIRGVGLRYFGREGETEALQNISLSVAPGEFIAIIGQSGWQEVANYALDWARYQELLIEREQKRIARQVRMLQDRTRQVA